MAEPRGNGIEAHAPIDGLGGQRVPKLVGRDVSNSCFCSLLTEDLGNPMGGNRTVSFDEEPVGADLSGTVICDPIVQELFELRMQGDVSVVVQLAERIRSQ